MGHQHAGLTGQVPTMRSARLWTTRVGLPCQPWFFLYHMDPACHHLVLFGVTNNKSVANPNKNRERLGRFTDSCRWPFPLRVFNQLGSEFSRRCLVSIAVTSSEREGREERNRAENAAATSRRHYRSGVGQLGWGRTQEPPWGLRKNSWCLPIVSSSEIVIGA